MAGPADSCSLLPGRIGQCTRFFERKHRVHSRGFWLVFGATLLSYTFVKFNQEKNEVGTRATQRGIKPRAAGDRLRRLHCRT